VKGKTESEDIITTHNQIFGDSLTTIFKDPGVLSPDYIPLQLIGRNDKMIELGKLLKPIEFHLIPNNGLVFGKTGSGKSVTTKFVMIKFMERLEDHPEFIDHKVCWVYVQCKKRSTQTAVLYEIITQLDPFSKIPKRGISLDAYYEELCRVITDRNISLIVILDEIDQLKGDDILYLFVRSGEMQEIPQNHFICTIGISNDGDFGTKLDPRILSSMDFKEVIFHPYKFDQIMNILQYRVKLAFNEGVISEETIIKCAKDAAQAHGDARRAISLLRSAATLASIRGEPQIMVEYVIEAGKLLDQERLIRIAIGYPIHERIVLLSIVKLTKNNNKGTDSQKITSFYNTLCKELGRDPLHRTTIASKFGEFKMTGLITSAEMKKGRGGGWRDIKLNVKSIHNLEEALYDDDELKYLKDVNPSFFGNI
jgi:archaeal cell division control protein 6